MSDYAKNLVNFQIKENLNGKKERILYFNCSKCKIGCTNLKDESKCIACFLARLFDYREKKIENVEIEYNKDLIEKDTLILFIEYFKIVKLIKKSFNSIKNYRNKKCAYKDFQCKVYPDFTNTFNLSDSDFLNPIEFYERVQKLKQTLKKNKDLSDNLCKKCNSDISDKVYSINHNLDGSEIIKTYKSFKAYNNHINLPLIFLNEIILKKFSTESAASSKIYRTDFSLIEEYNVGAFNIRIIDIPNDSEKFYQVTNYFDSEADLEYSRNLIEDVLNHIGDNQLKEIVPLEELIELYQNKALRVINSKYDLSEDKKTHLSFLIALKKINLYKIFPLLVDDFIEEIFLDSPDESLYLNHQLYHRCRTDIQFNNKEIERLKTFLRIYSHKRLDYKNPGLKYVIKNRYFYCRFSVDIDPINIKSFSIDVRKLNKNILTIQDLLKNRTLNPEIAAFLYFCILRRKNITVTGETDSGKTTLINALDLLTPKELRKIYIENVNESLEQIEFEKHQLKYRVDSLSDSGNSQFSKSNQIKRLLHRSPDLIYLGEILTKEEAEAMFHCLAAGLRGFQTIHSNNIKSLINRFLYHFKINKSCLEDLDLLILMKKNRNNRKIISISEITDGEFENDTEIFKDIIKLNPKIDNWIIPIPLFQTRAIQSLKSYEHLTNEVFRSYFALFVEIFDFLLKSQKLSNYDLVQLFHKTSFYSLKPFTELKSFWKRWKNGRSLNP